MGAGALRVEEDLSLQSPTKSHLQLYNHVKHLVHQLCIIHCTV